MAGNAGQRYTRNGRTAEGTERTGPVTLALTNWSHETFPVARSRFAFFDCFEGIVVSGDERLIKPDPVIFHRLLTRYDIAPQRAVYIDDSPRNVSAAARVGFHALRFVDARQLRKDLIALGLPLHKMEPAQ